MAMYSALGLPVHRYSSFISKEENKWASEKAKNILFSEIGKYQWQGMAVGEHALAGALRFFARGTLDEESWAEPILRRYFQASLLAARATENFLNAYRFDTAVFHHGIYMPQGLVEPAQRVIESRHYIPHVRQRGEEVHAKKRNPRYKARRWIVERTLSWLNRYRKLLVRFEKKASSHEALLDLACASIVFRRVVFIYG